MRTDAEDAGGGSIVGQDDPAGGAQKKMVSPTQRRSGVVWAREAYRLPERRACRAMGSSRSGDGALQERGAPEGATEGSSQGVGSGAREL